MSKVSRRVFVGKNVVLDCGHPRPATIIVDIRTGKITDVEGDVCQRHDFPGIDDADWIDAGDSFILPGIGTAIMGGFWTGTRAAASGGVTTVVDMPLNSIPPTTTVENLSEKRKAAQGQCWTDVTFWGGVIPGNQAITHPSHLKPLVDAGVRGFKCFLIESGVDEFPCVSEADLRTAMDELKASQESQSTSTVLCFHAELDKTGCCGSSIEADSTLYTTFLSSRPQQLEIDAITLITTLHQQYPSLRLHIVHLSAALALPLIRAAKASGLPLTVETCFHYLCLSAEHIPDGRPDFKCCPPVREESNREALWEALLDGTIDCVVSDHSPCVAALKKMEDGDIMSAWGGISTLGLGLSLLWMEGRKRGVEIGKIVEWVCVKTALHAGLADRKGQLKVGYDADLVIWDPEAEIRVTKTSLNFKNKLTPYEGFILKGKVEKTFLRGALAYDGASGFDSLKPSGRLL
ncbi:Allantoinase [Grifola frondosa]|uniref:allantoinase n=1 Tax=Grifola frondosa TaxID=5627 RepID=A0A1C7MKK7_GRIFR|nr:Allantoinase [Grifola frondosa]